MASHLRERGYGPQAVVEILAIYVEEARIDNPQTVAEALKSSLFAELRYRALHRG